MARRGGRRERRYVVPGEVPAWCRSGRWGPRRARVSQCWSVLRTELVYTQLLKAGTKVEPAWSATLQVTVGARTWSVAIEVRENAVWRCGRLFFRCALCRRRATRLYVPVETAEPRCRRCWGLSYESQSWSYHDGGFLVPARYICHITTERLREERQTAALERYAERRPFLPKAPRTKEPLPQGESWGRRSEGR
jgi:hypothetical protein